MGADGNAPPAVQLKGVTKHFGKVIAVHKIDLEIPDGSLTTLLGPSGCGKTTILRMIAGLEKPTEGDIFIKGQRVNDTPIHKRNLGMIFQNYALFPHKTIFDNVAFGLKYRNVSKADIKAKVKQALETVRLPGVEMRMPSQLSGGQQQRIALARMLAYRPKLFLMDEPLSNLDARLRMDMRAEIKRLHHVAGATTIYVTHDQVEALTMSSYIAIMKEGVLQQLDTPDRVYHYPANLFVADFIGNPKVNLLDGVVDENNSIDLAKFKIAMDTSNVPEKVVVAARPEDIAISTEPVPGAIEFTAYSVLPSGADSTILARLGDIEITVREMGISKIKMDDKIWLKFDPATLNLYDKESGNLITSKN